MNSPPAQFLLMVFANSFKELAPVSPAWQTLPSESLEDRKALFDGLVIGAYDMIFTGDVEYTKKLDEMGMLRGVYPVFRERLILVGPDDFAPSPMGLGAGDIMKKIFTDQRLFFSPIKNKWIVESESAMWSGLGVKNPADNRQYVETGRDDVDALYLVGDEGGFMLVGEASFAQYVDSARTSAPIVKLADTEYYRTSYVCLISTFGFRKERTAAADKYVAWLKSDDGRKVIEDFNIGGITPFVSPDSK
jgi:ABC-type tungstate transport system permease subunit